MKGTLGGADLPGGMDGVVTLARRLALSFALHDPEDRAAARRVIADRGHSVSIAELKEEVMRAGILRALDQSNSPQRVRFGSRGKFLNGGEPVVPRTLPPQQFGRWLESAAKAGAIAELRDEDGPPVMETWDVRDLEDAATRYEHTPVTGDNVHSYGNSVGERLRAELDFDPDEEPEEKAERAETHSTVSMALFELMQDALEGRPALQRFLDDALDAGFAPGMNETELAGRLRQEPSAVRKNVQRIREACAEFGEAHRRHRPAVARALPDLLPDLLPDV